ncbi:MAG: hypothetical protein IPM27_06290 [Nitrosomonadales bacterium]|nr:hypothetical protein [Nitrosomonadales bacterium]
MNIWTEKFKEPEVEFPHKLLANLISSFEDVAENLASLRLVRLDGVSKMTSHISCEFQFKLVLVSDELSGYSFEVFRFGYGVTLYPVEIIFEDDIGEELGVAKANFSDERSLELENQEVYMKTITAALTSNRFKETVGGLIKIARENQAQRAALRQKPKM